MTKVVINTCFGGFGLSRQAKKWLKERGVAARYNWEVTRDNPLLVECVEVLGDKANGNYAKLVVVEIPDEVEWQVEAHDGKEHIAEKHGTWWS